MRYIAFVAKIVGNEIEKLIVVNDKDTSSLLVHSNLNMWKYLFHTCL